MGASGPLRLALCLLLLWAAQAWADTYPSRPIRIVVAFPAGGGADLAARVVGRRLSESLGQPVIIDNRPGANGNIGTDLVVHAPADGYTLLLGSNANITTNPHLYHLAFDPMNDLVPVAMLAVNPMLLFVNPRVVNASSLAPLLHIARSEDGALDYASAGTGSPGHMAAELLQMAAGVRMTHVPYKGGTPAVNDVLGGRIGVMFAAAPTVLAYIRSGRLRALATSGAGRTVFAPDIPTVAESGYPDFDVVIWNALFAPAQTPASVVHSLHDEIDRLVSLPEIRQALIEQGAEPLPMDYSKLVRFIQVDFERWGQVVRSMGIRAD